MTGQADANMDQQENMRVTHIVHGKAIKSCSMSESQHCARNLANRKFRTIVWLIQRKRNSGDL